MINEEILDNLIVGRSEPKIYAFTTGTVPNYLKVGDTYRGVNARLNEWKKYYPDLMKEYENTATINDNIYFRDYSIHNFLLNEKDRKRLLPNDLEDKCYYSNEFFENATKEDVEEAILDIKKDYENQTNKYVFYNSKLRLPEENHFARVDTFEPRKNQQEAIDKFKVAVNNGRTNLLMYAVMRFGKSFTSMCCAVEMNAEIVVIVSAKADVKSEWKRTVESHVKFADYVYLDSNDLKKDDSIIANTLSQGKKVAIFLTLQDLQGDVIKEKHKEVFENNIDLLLIDETHFGARADKYGAVLQSKNYLKDIKFKKDLDDYVDVDEAYAEIKKLNAKVRIHLSGTPYRILMGNEFEQDDIISFCQFADIIDEQEKWDNENLNKDGVEEWDNPYYAFPQMIRFAFNPNKSAREKLKQLKESGVSYAFSALFKPKSIQKDEENSLHKKFENEAEILDLLEVIDGTKEDSELLSFLNYDKIQQGKMCRNIVKVLPYCASCDAMEELIKNNSDKFIHLSKYEIINISGVDNPNKYKKPEDIINKIKKLANEGKPTITLTVNRMLTGSTVPEWDTMLYFKDTSSPQEYDQAIFRLQNPFVKVFIGTNGKKIKYNMKPQTLLVDFNPNRMFVMQETKSKIYNVNIDEGGNDKLQERIKKELEISPIITINKDKIKQVESIDILEAISEYKKDKSVMDEANNIPVDLDILNNDTLRNTIEKENEIGSNKGLSKGAYDNDDNGEGDDLDTPPAPEEKDKKEVSPESQNPPDESEDEEKSLIKKIKSYYSRILLYAFITDDKVSSLQNIIDSVNVEENKRILKNLGLIKDDLILLHDNINGFVLSNLDYSIYWLNSMSKEEEPVDIRVNKALKKFGKLGQAVVITPLNICNDMINLMSDEFYLDVAKNKGKILDISSVAGEFALAIYNKMLSLGIDTKDIINCIYSIPKNSICYELTRKVYLMLGLNIDNIANRFDCFDLLKVKKNGIADYDKINKLLLQNKPFSNISLEDNVEGVTELIRFNAVVGNPPYNEIDGGGTGDSATPLYQYFVEIAKKISSRYVSMITPSRWMKGGKGLAQFRKDMMNDEKISNINDYADFKLIFPNIFIDGGVSYFLWDDEHRGELEYTYHAFDGYVDKSYRKLNNGIFNNVVRDSRQISIINKSISEDVFSEIVSTRNPYGFYADLFNAPSKYPNYVHYEIGENDCVIYGVKGIKGGAKRIFAYVNENLISKRQLDAKKYKLFFSKAYMTTATVPPTIIVSKPNEVCTETFLQIGPFDTEDENLRCLNYIKTKYFRALLFFNRSSLNISTSTFDLIPMQDFTNNSDIDWSKSVADIDKQLYAKYGLTNDEINYIETNIQEMK